MIFTLHGILALLITLTLPVAYSLGLSSAIWVMITNSA